MRADRAPDDDAAARTPGGDLLDLEPHQPVVDQHLVAGTQHFADRRRRDRQLAVLSVHPDDDDDLLARQQLHRRGEVADADLRALQVADQRDGTAGALLRLPDEPRAGGVIVMRAVGKVEARGIHAGGDESVELSGVEQDGPIVATIFVRLGVTRPWTQCSSRSGRSRKRRPTGVGGVGAECFLDAQQLVVLRHAVRARRRPGLDLADTGRDGEIGDRRVLGLAGPVRHDARVAVRERASSIVSSVSVSVPIWLTLIRIALATPSSMPALESLDVRDEEVVARRAEDRSPSRSVSAFQPAQSSSARPSSIETIG